MVRKIGLAGKSGSGKNVIADILCAKHGYTQIAVADGIRNECATFLWEAFEETFRHYGKPEKRLEFLEVVYPAMEKMIWEKPTPSGIRVWLQWWGTEFRRSQNPDYWISLLADRLRNDKLIAISDVRLPDEMKTIREAGGQMWLIVRDGISNVGISGHATEHGLDDAEFNVVIENNGTLQELETKVDALMVDTSTP